MTPTRSMNEVYSHGFSRVLCDASYLLALYDSSDQWAPTARTLTQEWGLDHSVWILPWPIVYEVLSTRMARRHRVLQQVLSEWQKRESARKLVRWDDSPYRDGAVMAMEPTNWGQRSLSLADHVVRSILEDPSCRVEAFVTHNEKDFIDICTVRDIICLY